MSRVPVALAIAVVAAALGASTAASAEPSQKAARIARGKYLVHQVAMCTDCHSPRDAKGQHVPDRHLQGAPLDFKSTAPGPKWAEAAPPIAGLPGWTDAQAVTLLTTGKDQKGEPPEPPMPQYRMSKDDATAVVAYLRSLEKPASK